MSTLAIGEQVFWPDGKVSVMTEGGLVLTPVVDWRVTWAVANPSTTPEDDG